MMVAAPAHASAHTDGDAKGCSLAENGHENRIWSAQREGRTAFGMSMKAASTRILDSAAHAGLDFVRLDLSGNSIPLEAVPDLVSYCLAKGITPTARVADVGQIKPVLAAGVVGITLPNITSRQEAADLADLCRREAEHLGNQLLVSVQIESVDALEDVTAIAGVPGIHMLQSGRNDLAKSMGLLGRPGHPQILAAEETIAQAAHEAGKLLSLHFAPGGRSIEQAQAWVARHISCLTIGADTQILDEALCTRADAIRHSA